MFIPTAPYIREAESRGTDYMYEWIYGNSDCDDDEDDEEDEEFEE